MDKRKLLLVFWLGGILFPLNLILKPALARQVLSVVFTSELTHVVMHTLLFSSFTFLLILLFDLPLNRRTAILMAICVLAAGLGQEFFQLQVKQRAFSWPEVFDLCVDLNGGALGWFAYRTFLHYRRYLQIAYFILRDAATQ